MGHTCAWGIKGVYMSIGVKEDIEVYIQGSFGAYMAMEVYGGIHGQRGIWRCTCRVGRGINGHRRCALILTCIQTHGLWTHTGS